MKRCLRPVPFSSLREEAFGLKTEEAAMDVVVGVLEDEPREVFEVAIREAGDGADAELSEAVCQMPSQVRVLVEVEGEEKVAESGRSGLGEDDVLRERGAPWFLRACHLVAEVRRWLASLLRREHVVRSCGVGRSEGQFGLLLHGGGFSIVEAFHHRDKRMPARGGTR